MIKNVGGVFYLMRLLLLVVFVIHCAASGGAVNHKRLPLTSIRKRVDFPLLPGVPKHIVHRAPGTNPLVINPIYGAGFTGNSSTAVYNRGVVNAAIAFYQSTVFTVTPITFNIVIQSMNSGLGQSTTGFLNLAYSTFSSALVSHSPSAMAAGVAGTNEPVTGSATINAKTAELRALGLVGATTQTFCNQTAVLDGCIEVNLALTDVAGGGDGSNNLLTTLQHEINEVIGMGSALPDPGDIFPEDLFRWASPGVRSYATNPSTTDPCTSTPRAYFSASATGALGTNLSDFNNCNNGGDYGDWATVSPPVDLVQNAFGQPGGSASMAVGNPESTMLALLGYTVSGTAAPTKAPTAAPTKAPTTAAPTAPPTTAAPTKAPTTAPPTTAPPTTEAPTEAPTEEPTTTTTEAPTTAPPSDSNTGLWVAVGVLSAVAALLIFSLIMALIYNSMASRRAGYTRIRGRNNYV